MHIELASRKLSRIIEISHAKVGALVLIRG